MYKLMKTPYILPHADFSQLLFNRFCNKLRSACNCKTESIYGINFIKGGREAQGLFGETSNAWAGSRPLINKRRIQALCGQLDTTACKGGSAVTLPVFAEARRQGIADIPRCPLAGTAGGILPREQQASNISYSKYNGGGGMSVAKPVLYSYWRSSCSWRVRIALNLKEIPYDIKPVSLIKGGGEQHCNEYRDVNPMEQVPSLHIDGHTLVESLSIMHYLEETRPQRPLMPIDCLKRAKVREICEVISSGIQPLQNLVVLIYVGEEKKKEWAQHWITRGFRAVEKLLSGCSGKYCVGDELTLADCCLIPQVFNARRFHVDLRPYPIILRIDRELENHPAFRAAHPSSQPDCPPEATK